LVTSEPGPVMVWTPAQTGAFLDFAAEERLYALITSDTYTSVLPEVAQAAAETVASLVPRRLRS
jgi:hypothetical protein